MEWCYLYQTGIYTYDTLNMFGCDSLAVLDLIINNLTVSTTEISSCSSYEWNGATYSESGVYTFDTTNIVGCDSIATLILSVETCGCTDSLANNYDNLATQDDGSCTYDEHPCDIVPSGLFVDNVIHNRIVFNWSAPSAAPSHYMIRYRPVGSSSWTVMTAALC